MNSHMELGRIAGIPIYLDLMFIALLLLFGYPYFTTGDPQAMSVGLLFIAGLLLSILLHEFGHAIVARCFGVKTREIELTGLGGVARFANALPRSALKQALIFLAGPAVNLALWYGLENAAVNSFGLGKPFVSETLATLAFANFWLLVFNLLPAFPLDGGRTVEALVNPLAGAAWAVRIVAVLGLLCTAGCVWFAIASGRPRLGLLLLAYVLYQHNWQALQSVGGLRGGR